MWKKSKEFMLSPPVIMLTIFVGASVLWHQVKDSLERVVLKEVHVNQSYRVDEWGVTRLLDSYDLRSLVCVQKPSGHQMNYVKNKKGDSFWIVSCHLPVHDFDLQLVKQDQRGWVLQVSTSIEQSALKDLLEKQGALDKLTEELQRLHQQTKLPKEEEQVVVPGVSKYWFTNESGSVSLKVKMPKNGAEK